MQPSHPYGALGANFNEQLAFLRIDELLMTRTEWVRGFFPMPWLNPAEPLGHEALQALTRVKEAGLKTILSLSFPFGDAAIPTLGTDELEVQLERVRTLVPALDGIVDILVIGNEPFLQTRPEDRNQRLNQFYEAVANEVIGIGPWAQAGALYMGAFNRLDLPEYRTPDAERWMQFVRETPEIAGVDIHPHLPHAELAQEFLDFILPRMRPDQTFLVTEFSIVWHWQAHFTDAIDPDFATEYGYPPETTVWQVVAEAARQPFAPEKWLAFVDSCDWIQSQRDFLRDQMALYRNTGRLAVATYGFRHQEDMVSDMSAAKVPWLFNSIFPALTVHQSDDGTPTAGHWFDSYRELQQA
jgi:hypothetical protein